MNATPPPKAIDRFTCETRFLSNFWPAKVVLDGVEYPTVEHAYQAAKSDDPCYRTEILNQTSPGRAKHAGRHTPPRPGWYRDRDRLMLNLVRQKFARGSDLAAQLLATGDAELIEGNTWNDRYWGVCEGEGHNKLGLILMQVRAELAEHETTVAGCERCGCRPVVDQDFGLCADCVAYNNDRVVI